MKMPIRWLPLAAALLVGLLFGHAPAWQSNRLALANAMSEDGRTTGGAGGRLRRVLVAGEVTTCLRSPRWR